MKAVKAWLASSRDFESSRDFDVIPTLCSWFLSVPSLHTLPFISKTFQVVSFSDPPQRGMGGSGEYSTFPHYGLAVAMIP